MPDHDSEQKSPHLLAALIALGVVGSSVLASLPWLNRVTSAPDGQAIHLPMEQRNLGEVLVRAAWDKKDVLPVYGSSELTLSIPNRCSDFFSGAPTGFQVCPVGKPGSSCLMIAQRLAALGGAARGKKVVILVSFAWFRHNTITDDNYAGNFSPLHACTVALSEELDAGVQRRIVHRMLDFPESLDSQPVLEGYLDGISADSPWQHLKRVVCRPFLVATRARLAWEDKLATVLALKGLEREAGSSQSPGSLHAWDKLIEQAEEKLPADGGGVVRSPFVDEPANKRFTNIIDNALEWQDFTLLLDVLESQKMTPLIISMPLAGVWDENHGVTRASRDHFYKRLEDMCEERGFAVKTWSEHDLDTGFIIERSSHLTEKGWLYVNRLLDDFYHDQVQPVIRTRSKSPAPVLPH